jgi:hypothetical protein
MDAALHLCARSTGPWALALPGGALVTLAALAFTDAIREGQRLDVPSLALAAAWCARAVCQGATAHFVERQLLGPGEPTARSSLAAALRRLPSLITAAAAVAAFNLVTVPLTVGVALLALPSHLVAYAAVMHGRGHPLFIYRTCARLLGPARGAAASVRAALWTHLLVALNLHIASGFLFFVARKLLGIDLIRHLRGRVLALRAHPRRLGGTAVGGRTRPPRRRGSPRRTRPAAPSAAAGAGRRGRGARLRLLARAHRRRREGV